MGPSVIPRHCLWAFAVATVLSACGDPSGELGQCPMDAASGAPGVVKSTATQLWRWPPGAEQPTKALVDERALYWSTESGAIWRFVKGSTAAEELRPAPGQLVSIRGLVADEARVYWGESRLISGFELAPVAPGQIWAAAKDSFEPRLLFEDPSATRLIPASVVGSDLYAQTESVDGPFIALSSRGGASAEVPEIPLGARLYGDRYYWVERGETEDQGALFRGSLSDPTAHSLGTVEGSELDVGPDHVLWHRDRYDAGPPQVLYQSFVVIDERRGCMASMPEVGESISFATAVDAEHVYWHSWNKLGEVRPYADGRTGPALPDYPMYRTNLASGRTERIETPGFGSPEHSFIVGQDAEHIYVTTPDALVSVDKPPTRHDAAR